MDAKCQDRTNSDSKNEHSSFDSGDSYNCSDYSNYNICNIVIFTNSYFYETILSYKKIPDANNSTILDDIKHIPKVKEFLAKHVSTNRMIFAETNPMFTNLHASGGYTGEYAKTCYPWESHLLLDTKTIISSICQGSRTRCLGYIRLADNHCLFKSQLLYQAQETCPNKH